MFRRAALSGSCPQVVIVACVAGALGGATAQAQTFPLRGVMRDFHRTDPYFAVAPVGGNGHYAGNIALSLSTDERPQFIGGGHKVLVQWRDMDNHAIAPHMFLDASGGGGTVPVETPPTITNDPTIDTYDPAMGPYGGANIGPAPTFVPGSTMPALSEPTGLGPSVGDVSYSGNGVSTLSANLHCDDFRLRNYRTLRIAGAVTILCEGNFTIENHTALELLDGASLSVYVKGVALIENNVDVNINTFDSSRMLLFNMGSEEFRMENSARVCARVVSPDGPMHVRNNADFYGRFSGESAIIGNSGGFHIESGVTICGEEPADIPGVFGLMSSGGIPSPAAFNTWFSDVIGRNMSMPYTMILRRDSSGMVWQLLNSSFHPIDGLLFGNEQQGHNNFFTFAAEVRFVHHACAGGFFEFAGNDDAWLFVNGDLVMDRGGVMPGTTPQYVQVDRLGLMDGQTYTLHFFYAQRTAVMSNFRLRTNLDLLDEPQVLQMSAAVD
jgi:fibro-slime domain-containing protein